MFSYEEIQKYNDTEIEIYKYIISNIDKIQYMTIRELAKKIHVSTSTILRFCNKSNFDGYVEFKDALKREKTTLNTFYPSNDLQELSAFFMRTNSCAFEKKISDAVEIIRKTDLVIFIGMGSSGSLAKYGARCFSNMGKFSVGLEDIYYPVDTYTYKNAAVIALSESGESKGLIEMVKQFQHKHCDIISITNSSASTLAKISDWNFSYHLNQQRINGGYNATTQLPVLFIIETLAKRV